MFKKIYCILYRLFGKKPYNNFAYNSNNDYCNSSMLQNCIINILMLVF